MAWGFFTDDYVTNNGDGTWTVQTNNIDELSITPPSDYTGALVLNVTESCMPMAARGTQPSSTILKHKRRALQSCAIG